MDQFLAVGQDLMIFLNRLMCVGVIYHVTALVHSAPLLQILIMIGCWKAGGTPHSLQLRAEKTIGTIRCHSIFTRMGFYRIVSYRFVRTAEVSVVCRSSQPRYLTSNIVRLY